jgi:hypothetical protein
MQINFLKTKKTFKKTKLYLNSDFYWGLIICIVFVIALASALFGFYLFRKVNKELVISAKGLDPAQTVKKERLDKAAEYFSGRAEKSVKILNSPAPAVDPSL